ncbi:SGNH/GDSL hydrolase family protein [Actinacidiphila bryophytorum]|uniref:SGNH hydrolase-type esterase domain-containing protein n=2 Tax=Actinacidiphila bryophytorum TaxID=1436133 RepID=A0A9W4E973_9ACTN|nr:hypothetical protein [Actinacidiphila bryophytorum]MBM9434253.1 hypothetical protein [Actinacidiphila bryophytorum]CAG7623966.1 conserved hypothetical protein [Actinacidiphila bryophytorum]
MPGFALAGAGPAAADSASTPPASGGQGTAAPLPDEPARTPGVPLAPRDDADGLTAAQRKALQAAHDRAAADGTPVTVDALTTGTSTTTANPSGTTTYNASLLPTRVRKNGAWTPVDATLVRNADGTYSPAAAVGALRLSGGGTSAPLAAMGSGAERLAFGWPTSLPALPAPTAAGDALTYAGVLPDVDLKVTATTLGGFSEVLVVKTPAAAADPRLGTLTLATTGTGVTVRNAGRDGLAAVTADGAVAFSAPAPLMWDSARAAGATPARTMSPAAHARSAVLPSAAAPQPGAHTAPLGVRVAAGALALTPDRALLTGKDTVYPVYIDPTWNPHPASGSRQHWAEVQSGCPTTSNYDSTKYGDPGVGDNVYSGCVGIERSYFQLGIPSGIWGTHIVSAVINTTETYAAQCDTTSTVTMYLTSAISSKTTWNAKPAAGTKIDSHSFAPACSSYVSGGFAATSTVASAAAGHWSSLTYVLINGSESNGYHFKRFAANPSVSITYNHVPNPPATPTVKLNSSTYGCATATPYPILGKTVATTPPSLTSVVSDTDKDALQATYTYWVGSAAKATIKSKDVSSGQSAPATFPLTYIKGLADGSTVNWQVSVTDGKDTKASTSTCHFTVDQRAPAEPDVTADVYPDLDKDGGPGAPAGTPGTFTAHVDPGSTQNAAAKFVFGLDVAPPTTGAPASQTKTATNSTATYTATPVAPGTHTLFVYALDSAGNESPMHEYHFTSVGHAAQTYPNLAAAFNNTAISDDAAPTAADIDGKGYSLSKQELQSKGWQPGGKITVDGATFTLPDFGTGAADNVLAANQTITMSGQQGNALVFLATSTYGGSAADHAPADHSSPYVPDGTDVSATNCSYGYDNEHYSDCSEASGTITYAGDTAPQSYYLAVPDWSTGPSSLGATGFVKLNSPTGQVTTTNHKIYAFAVPLAPGAQVSSVTLPDLSSKAQAFVPGLHILAMAVRDTTSAGGGASWTGAWSSPNMNLPYNFIGGQDYRDQTFRLAVTPSVGGASVRVKLSNRGNSTPLTIDHVTFAQRSAGSAAADTPATMTFGGSTSVVLPSGGELFSDPLGASVTANQPVLVSFHLADTVHYIPEHAWASEAVNYISAVGSGDHTEDVANTAFTGTGVTWGYFTDVVTGLDVVSPGNQPTVVTIGDGLIDTNITGTTGVGGGNALGASWRLGGRTARALQTNTQGVPNLGVLAADLATNRIATDMTQGWGGNSLLSRLDDHVLSDPGVTTVVIAQGLQDIVGGSDDTSLTSAYQLLLDQLQAWGIRTVIMTLTPCEGYAPCTDTVDAYRQTVNDWISGVSAGNPPGQTYVDANAGVAVDDPASTATPPEQQLSNQAAPLDFDSGDHVNLSVDGYAAVARTITDDLTVLVPPQAPAP